MRRFHVILLFFVIQAAVIVGAYLGLLALRESASASDEPVSNADEWQGSLLDPPIVLQDFSLPSTTGKNFTLSEHQGEVLLLFVGYTSCPDYCPTTLAELTRVYDALGDKAERVKVVFVTGDPERDTLERMTQYIQAFNPEFIGISVEGTALEALLAQFYATAIKQLAPDSALGYTIEHSTRLYLINPDGEWMLHYAYSTSYRDIVADIEKILE
jgi:protein SCO1